MDQCYPMREREKALQESKDAQKAREAHEASEACKAHEADEEKEKEKKECDAEDEKRRKEEEAEDEKRRKREEERQIEQEREKSCELEREEDDRSFEDSRRHMEDYLQNQEEQNEKKRRAEASTRPKSRSSLRSTSLERRQEEKKKELERKKEAQQIRDQEEKKKKVIEQEKKAHDEKMESLISQSDQAGAPMDIGDTDSDYAQPSTEETKQKFMDSSASREDLLKIANDEGIPIKNSGKLNIDRIKRKILCHVEDENQLQSIIQNLAEDDHSRDNLCKGISKVLDNKCKQEIIDFAKDNGIDVDFAQKDNATMAKKKILDKIKQSNDDKLINDLSNEYEYSERKILIPKLTPKKGSNDDPYKTVVLSPKRSMDDNNEGRPLKRRPSSEKQKLLDIAKEKNIPIDHAGKLSREQIETKINKTLQERDQSSTSHQAYSDK